MRADFQQFYNLNLDDMGVKYTYLHAAALVVQLPRQSRVLRAENPAVEIGFVESLLARIEYWTHTAAYVNTKDAKYGRHKPEPINFMDMMKPKCKEKIDVQELNEFLAKPRKAVVIDGCS